MLERGMTMDNGPEDHLVPWWQRRKLTGPPWLAHAPARVLGDISRCKRPNSRRFIRSLLVVIAATAVLVSSGCGSSDPDGPSGEDLGVVGDGAPFAGRFEELPRYPRSEPLGELSERGDTVTRSYVAEGASTELVLAFYEDSLPALGWEVLLEPQKSGTSTIQAEWSDDDLVLRITATDASSLGGDTDPTEAVRSQYSLILSET